MILGVGGSSHAGVAAAVFAADACPLVCGGKFAFGAGASGINDVELLLTGSRCGLTARTLIRGEGAVLSDGFIDVGPLADAVAGLSSGMGSAG